MKKNFWTLFFGLLLIFQNFALKAGKIPECTKSKKTWFLYKKAALVRQDRLRLFLVDGKYLRWCNTEQTKVYGQEELSNIVQHNKFITVKDVIKNGNKVQEITFPLKKVTRGRLDKKLVLYSCKKDCSKNISTLKDHILTEGSPVKVAIYSQKVSQESKSYSLPKASQIKENSADILSKGDLSKIATWKKVYVKAKKEFSRRPALLRTELKDPQYAFFKRDFFVKNLGKIRELYKSFYNESPWHGTKQKFSEQDNVKSHTFVRKAVQKGQQKIAIMGDLHSGLHSLLHFIFDLDAKGFFVKQGGQSTLKIKDGYKIAFTGDMVDRGPYGLEIIFFIFYLKQMNFDKVFVIKGNHEEHQTFRGYGFADEIEGQFGAQYKGGADPFVLELFNYLPSALYLGMTDKFYHLSHGVVNLGFAGSNNQGVFGSRASVLSNFLKSSANFAAVPSQFQDEYDENYRWSDAIQMNPGNARVGGRGRISLSSDFIEDYLYRHNIHAVIRGHQDATNIGLIRPAEYSSSQEVFTTTNGAKFGFTKKHNPSARYAGEMWEPLQTYEMIQLIPQREFILFSTSSAAIAKELPNTTYTILSSK